MITEVVAFIAGMGVMALISRCYNKLPEETKEKVQQFACQHDMRQTDSWSSDALGIPYGYRYYTCRKCGHKEKKFWYV